LQSKVIRDGWSNAYDPPSGHRDHYNVIFEERLHKEPGFGIHSDDSTCEKNVPRRLSGLRLRHVYPV
jgi:hypothetical protein